MDQDEIKAAVTDALKELRVQAIRDCCDIFIPLLSVLCAALPNPETIATALDAASESPFPPDMQPGRKAHLQTSLQLMVSLAAMIRAHLGLPPKADC